MHFFKRVTLRGLFSLVSTSLFLSGLLTATLALPVSAQTTSNVSTRQISQGGTTSITATAKGRDGLQQPEISSAVQGLGPDAAQQATKKSSINRGISPKAVNGQTAGSSAFSPQHSNLGVSFNGLNLRDQRLANGGNQFTIEPPDQGLCVGGGFVLETVNTVLNVYDTTGKSALGVTDLNTFYGYPAQINRTTGEVGPEITDPSCYFDQPTQRWFHVVLTIDVNPSTGNFTGPNHLDIAVSKTADPTGKWVIYRLPVQDNGTDGTPNHHCEGGPCLGDYPHIGADANGFYVTTNEYPFFADTGFHAAQIYAFSKFALAANDPQVLVTQFDTIGSVNGNPGFTVWPATSPDHQYAPTSGGTEYFLSSDAAEEANGNGSSNHLIVWSLTNTGSLKTSHPAPVLSNDVAKVKPYSIPPLSTQKPGDFPLGQCLNDPSCANAILGKADPYAPEHEGPLDSNDTRMQQVTYAGGLLWGALDTAVKVNGVNEAGIEWFVVSPFQLPSGVVANLVNNGYLAAKNANVIYPAIGITAQGRGAMTFTLVGPNNYPSAAYTTFDFTGPGPIQIAAAGLGPQDGFTEYKAFGTNGVPRPRWGDYGAAVPVGHSVWMASEYIGQTCSLAEYEKDFSCHQTRATIGNWYTRISRVDL